jgi:kumamolisin
LTVADFAINYDVQPLYDRGVTGRGRTLGIITLASFTPSDAFAYWSALGLKVSPKRIKIVDVDGGPGSPSDASGSLETTIDVEQSGGIAPGAKIIVYQAPNTNQGFVDVFAKGVEDDIADTVSCSWGFWEWFQNAENSPANDPITGQPSGVLEVFHELILRAAIQGQTLYAASGDGGAYDVTNDLGCHGPFSTTDPNSCTEPLSVDNPASDPYMTAAGGTTLPGTISLCLNPACTPPLFNITHKDERVWGWDYFLEFCEAIGTPDPIQCGVFPAGSGGGVSVIYPLPSYQDSLSGIQSSQPLQVWQSNPAFAALFGVLDFYVLPSHFPGRNVPDVSFNADPYTGYLVYYTSDVSGFGLQSGWGGTSFVAPQLNGVSALLGQEIHDRIGLMNFPLYDLACSGQAYDGPNAPLKIISHGDNWFYHGRDGYSPAVGLGTMDVANFGRYLHSLGD